jgi:response regulator of citrate/malate metabolism
LISQIRVEGADSDVIVISAANESDTVERAVKLGVASYLLKPFTLNDLAARLNEYKSQPRSSRRRTLDHQAEVDRIFGRTEQLAPLPKGMSTETAELILAVLNEQAHELSAQECAEAIGVSRVSARRYLEHFVREGRVRVTLRYGSPGRPERRYVLSDR